MGDTPAVRAAVKEVVEKCAPLLESVRPADLSVARGPEGQDERRHVLPALLTLPDEVLQTLHGSFMAECIRTSMSIQGVALLSTAVPGAGFILDEAYLKRCNHEALLELWADVGLPPEGNASDEYLRAMLLEEAPALAERGWLPRPLVSDVELEGIQVEAQALIFKLTKEQARALLLDLDPADDELGDASEYPGMLLDEVRRMSPEELCNWTALWQHRAAD
jgi:hypothetical protein